MSDSSSEEDVRLAAAAVDPTFLDSYRSAATNGQSKNGAGPPEKRKSERHLAAESHYNDVRFPDELQRRIADKLSRLIERSVEFVPPPDVKIKKRKIKGGVKLFSTSESYLSADVEKDTATEEHNENSRQIMKKKRETKTDTDGVSEQDKLKIVAVTADHVLSGEETKHWKSRRKEKLFKYKSKGKSKVLISLDPQ